jgi:hypothetical protein
VNILLQSQQDAEIHFGKSAIMAPGLLGMVGQGENAVGYSTGDMNQGFDITVGFFNGKARYVAFQKRRGTIWTEGDLRAALMQIGKYSDWSVKPGSDYFDYAEKVGKEVLAEATGWQTPKRRYVFAYIPDLAGEIGLIPDKAAIDQRFPSA